MASHLIDARGTVEPNVDPKGVESRLRDGVFVWLDIDSPTEADFKLLKEVFELHPLALEDARKFGQRPKIESYDDFTVLVVFGAVDDPTRRSGLAPIEVHCFYSEKWLVTVHKGECSVFDDLRNQTHKKLQRYEEGLGILYLVVDELVDSFLPQLSELDDEFDELEDTILTDPQPSLLQQAITMKRQLVQLRKIVNPQRDMFAALLSGRYELPGMTPEHERYFRDVYDHLIRVSEQLDDYRDLASGTTDLYQSTVGNKMNLTMKQLGWVATFFLPLSFLTGFFGQNFTLLVGTIIRPRLDVLAARHRARPRRLHRRPALVPRQRARQPAAPDAGPSCPCRTESERALLGGRALVPGGERQGPALVRGSRPRVRAADAARRADPGLLTAFAVDRPLLGARHVCLARLHRRARAHAALRPGPARSAPGALGRRFRRRRDLPALGVVFRSTRPEVAPRLASRAPVGDRCPALPRRRAARRAAAT